MISTPPDQPETPAPQPAPADPVTVSAPARKRSGLRWVLLLVALLVIAGGAVAGLFVGRSIADENTQRDQEAAERASDQEDDARDRRDFLEARVRYIDGQTKGLGKVASDEPLLGSAQTTANVEGGKAFSVDGGVYTLRSFRVLDEFDSIDPQRPAKPRDGYRWALVEVDYTNKTREDQAPACGTMGTIHLILEDRSRIREVDPQDEKPPVAQGTYAACGTYVEPGQKVRWSAPVRVPEDAKLAGILVADVYVRTSHSEYNVQSGKQGWLAFDEPIDVGSAGDDEIEERFVEEDA